MTTDRPILGVDSLFEPTDPRRNVVHTPNETIDSANETSDRAHEVTDSPHEAIDTPHEVADQVGLADPKFWLNEGCHQ
jgi:hypothetical protein